MQPITTIGVMGTIMCLCALSINRVMTAPLEGSQHLPFIEDDGDSFYQSD